MPHFGLMGAVLYARDLQGLAEFYAGVTGLPIRTTRDDHAALGEPLHQLVIVRILRHIADAIAIETPPMRREETPIKLVFAVADIAAARNEAARRGGRVNSARREWNFEGATVCDGHDPEGNIFQLRQQPPAGDADIRQSIQT